MNKTVNYYLKKNTERWTKPVKPTNPWTQHSYTCVPDFQKVAQVEKLIKLMHVYTEIASLVFFYICPMLWLNRSDKAEKKTIGSQLIWIYKEYECEVSANEALMHKRLKICGN